MSGNADERLIVMLEARISEFEKRMRQAEGRGTRTYQGLRRNSRSATQAMEADMIRSTTRINQALAGVTSQIGGVARAFAGGFIGGMALTNIMRGVRGAVSDLARLGTTARDVGMDVEELQGLMRGFARETVLAEEDISSAFVRFNRRIGEAVNGAGPLQTTLERVGISVRRANGQMKTQGELLREVAEAVRNARTEQERLAIAQAAFGDSGRRMAQALAGGGEAMDRMIREARDAGDIIDRNLIHRTEILDARFNDLTRSVGRFFQSLAVTMVSGAVETPIDTLTRLFGTLERAREVLGDGLFEALIRETRELRALDGVVDGLSGIAGVLRDMPQLARRAGLDLGDLALIVEDMGEDGAAQLAALDAELATLLARLRGGEPATTAMQERLAEIAQEALNIVAGLDAVNRAQVGGIVGRLNALVERLRAARNEAVMLGQVLVPSAGENGVVVQEAGPGTPRPGRRPIDWLPGDGSGNRTRGGGGANRPEDFTRAVEAIRQRTRELEAEALALAAAAASGREYGEAILFAQERARLLSAAQREGLTVTPELEAQIDALAEAYIRAGDAAQTAADQMREAQERAQRGAEAMSDLFLGIIQGGDAAKQALAQLLQQLAQVQMQRAMMGLAGGGGGGFFRWLGGLLGGARAGGGPVQAGVPYLVNERTPNSEVFVPSRSGGVLNVQQAQAALRGRQDGGAQAVQVEVRAYVDQDGNWQAAVEKISADTASRAIQRARPQMMKDSVLAVYEHNRRHALR